MPKPINTGRGPQQMYGRQFGTTKEQRMQAPNDRRGNRIVSITIPLAKFHSMKLMKNFNSSHEINCCNISSNRVGFYGPIMARTLWDNCHESELILGISYFRRSSVRSAQLS
jgi:hypothetical protein